MNCELSTVIGSFEKRVFANSVPVAYVIINANQREGTARAVVEVAERLAKKHEVHLYSRTVEDLDLGRIRWHRVPGLARPEVANFASFLPLCTWMLRNRGKMLVHTAGCNVLHPDVVTIQNIQPAKIKLLNSVSRDETISVARRLTRWLHLRVTTAAEKQIYTHRTGRRSPLFLPVSRGVERELRSYYDLGPAIVRIIPNAADTAKFRPCSDDERAAWRQGNGVPSDSLMLLFAGGEWSRKGLDFALRALARVECQESFLYIAGDDPDRARFELLSRELRVGHRVIFGGFRSDIATVMGASDLFLFPSWYEAFSLVTIEAAACGLPVVASRINGTEDFIREGENGAFIDHDSEQIAQVLNGLLKDRSRLRSMGQCARECVERNYTWDLVARQTEEAYREYLEIREPFREPLTASAGNPARRKA